MNTSFLLVNALWLSTGAVLAQPAGLIPQVCTRDAACGCPIADCEAFFAAKALPDAVLACFAEQPCAALCAPDSGAPGSALYAACLAPPKVDSAAARLCARDAACGCPIADCEAFFAAKGLPAEVLTCFAAQPCAALCGPDSGAPGSPLHAACLAGAGAPAARTPCQAAAQCPAQHDCCAGFCYAMGTVLWQTQCVMPDGRF